MEKLIFGIDAGTSSVGAAAVFYDSEKNEGRIVRLVSRIFPEAREPRVNKFVPKNQVRRLSRQTRRTLRRRKQLRRDVNQFLAESNFLPNIRSEDWEKLMKIDPVNLRARGVEQRLERFEIGRAISHLAKNRQLRTKDQFEEAIVSSEDENNTSEDGEKSTDITSKLEHQKKTYGQYLNTINDGRSAFEKRNKSEKFQRPLKRKGFRTTRAKIEAEFDLIIKKQAEFYPELGSISDALKQIIFFQRPVFWRLNTLGYCRLEGEGHLPAPKGEWISAQRRMLEKLNNLTVIDEFGEEPLSAKMRENLLRELNVSNSLTWSAARKAAGIPRSGSKFNLEKNKIEPSLLGNPVEKQLHEIFGDGWAEHPHKDKIRDKIYTEIGECDYSKVGKRIVLKSHQNRIEDRKRAAQNFGQQINATPEQIEALANMIFPPNWDAFSKHALEKILPELEAGTKMGALLASPLPEFEEWRENEFPNRKKETEIDQSLLPSPKSRSEQNRLNEIRNPSVVRTQNQIRKVVNNLIDFCGRKPDIIRIELARDLPMGARDRSDLQYSYDKNKRERDKAAADLKARGIKEPKRRDIEKYLLWLECNKFDPYEGKSIGFDDLFRNGAFEVEHIWPYKRSFDDSYSNKTLASTTLNANKGNKLPFEYFLDTYGENSAEWNVFVDRVGRLAKEKKISNTKLKKFLATNIPDGFTERQLNDTRYASKQATEMLSQLQPSDFEGVYVQAVNKSVVGELRHLWGLSRALGKLVKDRDDHRHHAVDALVIALAEPKMINSLSSYWVLRDEYERMSGKALAKPTFPKPWPRIVEDATDKAERIMVSHTPQRKLNGSLHDQLPLRNMNKTVKSGSTTYGQYSIRTNVKTIDAPKFHKISNEQIRERMLQLLAEAGGDPKKIVWNPGANDPDDNFAYLTDKGGEKTTPITHVRIVQNYQPDLVVATKQGNMPMGNNHHIAIFKDEKGKGVFEPVSKLVVMERLSKRLPIVEKNRSPWVFLYSICLYDTIKILSGEKQGYWVVFGIPASGQLTIYRPNDADKSNKNTITVGALVAAGFQKLSVDPIGRIRYASG